MRYTQNHDRIVVVCSQATTLTEVEAKLGLTSPSGTLRRYIKVHSIPMPNYRGSRMASVISQKSRRKFTEADLCENSTICRSSVKKLLFSTGLKKEACEKCGWARTRSDGKCPVHLHHVNGNDSDNRLQNLKILCPNCHSLTENYAGLNKFNPGRRKKSEEIRRFYNQPLRPCSQCGKLGYGEKFCSEECTHLSQRKVVRPPKEVLAEEIKTYSWTALGRKYGVSDNAIRKWAKFFDLVT